MKILLSSVLVLFLVGCGSQDENKAVKKVEETKIEVKEEVIPKEKKIITNVATTGKSLFATCSSCHGVNAEKKALGKSQVIKDWDAAKIAKALNGYKDGTYGGAMKGIMKGQASKLSKEDIEKLSKYISKL